MRTATQDYVLNGQHIAANDWLMLSYVSGNRDEQEFESPSKFIVSRSHNPQIAFGFGAHVCLRQQLARLEMKIFFKEFFDRVESIEMTGSGRRNASAFVGGVKSVPLAFKMR